MARFSGRALGHAALLLVAALVAAACGTTQTAQAPTPSPSPSPPGGTVTIAGKVGFGLVFTSEPTAILFPARDGTVVGYWVTSTLPAGASRYERYLQALAGSRIASVAANARAKLQRLAQARARSKVVQPRITYPITAPPAGTATTTGGEYTLNVPASLVGQQITVCVLGPNVTGAPNPGDPSVPGLCGTMTVQANQGGSTFVNRMSFVLARQQLGTYFVLETQSNIFSTTPLGQATPIQLVTIAPLTAADNAFITNRLIVGMKPATWPNASVYAGNNPATTAALRVVGSVSGSTYSLRGRVQWRSDSVQNATYQLDARGGDDSVSFVEGEVNDLSCEWTPSGAANNGLREQQIVESGVVADVDQPFLWLMTTDSVILTPTAQAGYFVLPVAEPLGCVDFLVARDTSSPAFGEAPATLPESRPTGDRNLDLDNPAAGQARVVVPFPEPLLSDPSAAASFLDEPEWTLFIPANDQDDSTKARLAALWDAHVGAFQAAAANLHVDLSSRPDAATGARLDFDMTDPELTVPPPTPRQTFRVDWSAQLGDGWATANDPINVQDLAGNSTAPGPSLRWLGNVVP
ncbi:MAG: hypothetical protein QN130_14745 [Armatimonadota bacterium]|nr:hypothetical protein [Armatimonadota bacterium]